MSDPRQLLLLVVSIKTRALQPCTAGVVFVIRLVGLLSLPLAGKIEEVTRCGSRTKSEASSSSSIEGSVLECDCCDS